MSSHKPPQSSQVAPDETYLEYLKQEANHFYEAELDAERRASWLLTAAIGLLAVILNTFGAIQDKKVSPDVQPFLWISAVFMGGAAVASAIVLWPLRGKKCAPIGFLHQPLREWKRPGYNTFELWRKHYEAHRFRAEVRSVWIARTLLLFMLGVVFSIVSVLKNNALL